MTDGPEPALRIYTDASWKRHDKVGRGSWGAVLVWQDEQGHTQQQVFADEFRQPCVNSVTAELQAAANGIHMAIAAGRVQRGQLVEIVTDALQVVHMLQGLTRRRLAPEMQAGLQAIAQAAGALRLQVTARWTRGHQAARHGFDAQMNAAADKAARKANPVVMSGVKKSRAKLKKVKKTAAINAKLAAHGIDVSNAPVRESAVHRQLQHVPPGSPKALQLLQAIRERFPDADWSQTCLPAIDPADAVLEQHGVDVSDPAQRALAIDMRLHLHEPGTPAAKAQLGRFQNPGHSQRLTRARVGVTIVDPAAWHAEHIGARNGA